MCRCLFLSDIVRASQIQYVSSSEGDKCLFRFEVDEFGGQMLGVEGWQGALLLFPMGEAKGVG